MIIYDFIHGYQPFDPLVFIPKWIKKNLKDKFLPTSLAMKKGLIPRAVQLQGWTIESWLKAKKPIRDLAKETIKNLKIANQKGKIEIGISAYTHPVLPMLSSDLIKTQIILDRQAVEQYLGKVTWFWPPEGAVDQRTLKVIHQVCPDLTLLIPDKVIGRYNFNEFVKIRFKDGFQKAAVFNCLLKDLFMNAEDYRRKPRYIRRPKHLPKDLVWAQARRAVHSPKIFLRILEYLDKSNFILMRDWENAGSKKGLRKISMAVGGRVIKDIGNFLKLKDRIDFRLPSQVNWGKAKVISVNKIIPGSWDMESIPKNPFPWWQPSKQGRIWRRCKPFRKKRMIEWQGLIKEFNQVFQQKIKEGGGLERAIKDKKFRDLLKWTLPALHSCVGWHYFAKRDWKPDYQYSRQALKSIVFPALKKLKNEKINYDKSTTN